MLIFWSLVRNSVVLAVYLLFSVACFFTVHEHLLDLISMAALVYGALVAVGVPLALGRWCRHQVA